MQFVNKSFTRVILTIVRLFSRTLFRSLNEKQAARACVVALVGRGNVVFIE